jgi:formate/nitrite transporter FocA (FNT family)
MTTPKNASPSRKKNLVENEKVDELKPANAEEIHQAVTEEGADELDRPKSSLFWSALAAGIVVTTSLIAEGVLEHSIPETGWRNLLVSLGYSVGFLIVILGRMQLFTESTISAILPFVSKPSRAAGFKTVRLWAIVIIGNFLGTAIAAAILSSGSIGKPEHFEAMVEVSKSIMQLDAFSTFLNAIPAGFIIAVLAWTLPNARNGSAFWVILVLTWLIGAAGYTHSIVGSAEAFILLFNGYSSVQFTILGFMIPAVLGNLLGGAGIFALLAHAQVKKQLETSKTVA